MRIKHQQNLWGSPSSGYDAQRSDLWQLDLRHAVSALQEQKVFSRGFEDSALFTVSVSLPQLGVKGVEIRRESKPYFMPDFDEAVGMTKVTFLLDAGDNQDGHSLVYSSDIYKFLDAWRKMVRAGRGQMSFETEVLLDQSYRVNFRYDLVLKFLRATDDDSELETGVALLLKKAWLANFQVPDLTYKGSASTVEIAANFYQEDIVDLGMSTVTVSSPAA